MITQKELKEILHYDPEIGIFINKIYRSSNSKKGDIAGYISERYRGVTIRNKDYQEHRLAWFYVYGEWPKEEIDHINHDRFDNRIENLREVSKYENMKNQSLSKNNTSGCSGVHKIPSGYRVRISDKGKRKELGVFKNFNDAIIIRKMAEQEYGYHENHGY